MSEISVKIIAMSELSTYLGWRERIHPTKSQTIRGILSEIAQNDGKFRELVYNPTNGRFSEWVVILINGIDMKQRNGLDTPVFNNTEIECFYPFEGG